MQVRDVMTDRVECTRPSATLHAAADRMRMLDVGSLPVCGDGERLVGMITDRDIVIRAVARGLDPKAATVEEIMTPDVTFCFDDEDIEEAARIMEEEQIRRLVVLNRSKKLVGIVSLGDLAVETGDDLLSGHALEMISEPAHV